MLARQCCHECSWNRSMRREFFVLCLLKHPLDSCMTIPTKWPKSRTLSLIFTTGWPGDHLSVAQGVVSYLLAIFLWERFRGMLYVYYNRQMYNYPIAHNYEKDLLPNCGGRTIKGYANLTSNNYYVPFHTIFNIGSQFSWWNKRARVIPARPTTPTPTTTKRWDPAAVATIFWIRLHLASKERKNEVGMVLGMVLEPIHVAKCVYRQKVCTDKKFMFSGVVCWLKCSWIPLQAFLLSTSTLQ